MGSPQLLAHRKLYGFVLTKAPALLLNVPYKSQPTGSEFS